jgi:peptidoglycan/LPS O-acetylase OafA/YrhL
MSHAHPTTADEIADAITEDPPRKTGVRTDIQALRAIAVGSVMLYHLWANRLTDGYVGVDVFFAISGFLITSHLVAEIDRTGRLRPARFWARRAKRLVPASSLVLFLSALGVVTWVPRHLWRQFLNEIIASTVQVQNWLLANDSVDYLAANNTPSPTQHFWTLSAEEQFYVALPLLLLAATLLARLLLHRGQCGWYLGGIRLFRGDHPVPGHRGGAADRRGGVGDLVRPRPPARCRERTWST